MAETFEIQKKCLPLSCPNIEFAFNFFGNANPFYPAGSPYSQKRLSKQLFVDDIFQPLHTFYIMRRSGTVFAPDTEKLKKRLMAVSFNKRELEKKRQSKKAGKQERKEQRRANKGDGSLDDMIAYVDAYGNICDSPDQMQVAPETQTDSIAIATPPKEEMEPLLTKGKVEYFDAGKGYGFIRDPETGDKYFFHVTNAPEGIAEGQAVQFEVGQDQRGPYAMNITLSN